MNWLGARGRLPRPGAGEANHRLKLDMKKLTPVRGLLLALIVMVAFSSEVKLVAQTAYSKVFHTNANPDLDSGYTEYAKTMSARMPMMIDNETRLDSITYEKRVLKMSYTVMNASGPVSEEQKAKLSSAMTTKLQQAMCWRPQTQPLLNSGGGVRLSYFALDDTRLVDVLLNSAICKTVPKSV
jgi:hypothetical protein